MKLSRTVLSATLLTFVTVAACRSDDIPPETVKRDADTRFKGEKYFGMAVGDSAQADAQCKKLCRETCGGECRSITDIYSLCQRENPHLKYPTGISFWERLNLCVSRSPGFAEKYPYQYNATFSSEKGAPLPEEWPCTVVCH